MVKLLRVSDKFHAWLTEQGTKSESYEDILVRLVKENAKSQ